MSKPDMGSIIHIKNQWNILVIGNYYGNYQNYQNLMLLTSSDTKRTLMHLLWFTNSAQRELVSICTQRIHNRNWLSLPYILAHDLVCEVSYFLTWLFIYNILMTFTKFSEFQKRNCQIYSFFLNVFFTATLIFYLSQEYLLTLF